MAGSLSGRLLLLEFGDDLFRDDWGCKDLLSPFS